MVFFLAYFSALIVQLVTGMLSMKLAAAVKRTNTDSEELTKLFINAYVINTS